MIPQIRSIAELNYIKSIYDRIKKETELKHKMKLKINFGTMIEVVRACINMQMNLAKTAEFFSFGTNDLTQAVRLAFSREDAEGKFLPEYMEKELLERNPFQSIDVNGVGNLMKIGITAGRGYQKKIWKLEYVENMEETQIQLNSVTGEGLTYVSASPHRIPIAIVAAAQAVIEQENIKKLKPKRKSKK